MSITMMQWLAVLTVLWAETVSGLLNSTSVVIIPGGISVYPCLQVNHREHELDTALMGQWYVIEIILHREEPKNRSFLSYDVCPKLTLFNPSNSMLKVTWSEKGGDIQYLFKMTDPENSGYWMVWGKQTGSLQNKEQFVGSVQVVEAHQSRMVLTFCSSSANHPTHYSLVMVRNATIPQDTRDTRKALIDYGLREVDFHQTTCKDSSSSAAKSTALLAVVFALHIISSSIN